MAITKAHGDKSEDVFRGQRGKRNKNMAEIYFVLEGDEYLPIEEETDKSYKHLHICICLIVFTSHNLCFCQLVANLCFFLIFNLETQNYIGHSMGS